jgi:hypothetical protein
VVAGFNDAADALNVLVQVLPPPICKKKKKEVITLYKKRRKEWTSSRASPLPQELKKRREARPMRANK